MSTCPSSTGCLARSGCVGIRSASPRMQRLAPLCMQLLHHCACSGLPLCACSFCITAHVAACSSAHAASASLRMQLLHHCACSFCITVLAASASLCMQRRAPLRPSPALACRCPARPFFPVSSLLQLPPSDNGIPLARHTLPFPGGGQGRGARQARGPAMCGDLQPGAAAWRRVG
jgi:hypothetical protein